MERVVAGGRIIAIRREGGGEEIIGESPRKKFDSFFFFCGPKIMGDVQSLITSLTSHLSPDGTRSKDGGERKSP